MIGHLNYEGVLLKKEAPTSDSCVVTHNLSHLLITSFIGRYRRKRTPKGTLANERPA